MRRLIKLTASSFLFMIVATSSVLAEDWAGVVSSAEKNSNELISAKKQMESAEWTYKKTYSNFLPNISANASISETTSGTAEGNTSYSYGISATQNIFRGMENIYSLNSAFSDYEYYKANYKSVRATVYYELRSAFVDLLAAQENVSLLKKILDQRKGNARLIKLRYESGKEDKGNFMRTEADLAEAEYNLSSAERDLKLARLKLSQLAGAGIDRVDGSMEAVDSARPDFNDILEDVPSYLMARYQLEQAEINKNATISGFLPSLSVSGRWNKSGDEWPPERDSSSWSVNLSYSFFQGGGNFIDPIIYDIKLDKAKEDFEKSKKDIRFNLEDAFEEFKDAVESLNVKIISLAASEERAKIARAKYLNGLMSYDEWDRIETDYINAQKGLLTAQKGALIAEALWHKSYGGYIK